MHLPLTPIRFLEHAERLYGDKVGIVCGIRRFTYREFGERCRRQAGALRALGLQAGDRVAFLSWNCHRLLEAYYGVPMVGCVLLPLNVRLTAAELTTILLDSGARVLIYDSAFSALAETLQKNAPELQHCLAFDASPSGYDELIRNSPPLDVDFTAFGEDAIAEIFYTSGTTGNPKGVMLSHRSLYLHALHALIAKQYTDSMVQLHAVPLFHANGWGNAHMLTAVGARHVLLPRFDPAEACRFIQQERVTALCLVPTMAVMLLEHLESGASHYDLSSLEWTELGGAAASAELIGRMEKVFGCLCYCGYGLTESGPVLSISRLGELGNALHPDERLRRKAMTGREIVGAELRVVDDAGREVARDGATMGELVARSDSVMEGYWQNASESAKALRDGWLHTGDMAVWDEHGFIRIVDRRKEIIISGGENISSLEIEQAINSHPAVQESAVIAVPDAKWGEAPKAIVVLKAGSSLSEQELLVFLGARLAGFKLPRCCEFRRELPKSGTGKIQKKLLREKSS